MSHTYSSHSRGYADTIIRGVTAGFFFILIGIIFATTPNLFRAIEDFLRNIRIVRVFPNADFFLPAPAQPATHQILYNAVQQFALVWGIFLIATLVARIVLRLPLRTISDNAGDMVFWLSVSYLVQILLIQKTEWFAFWAVVIIIIGISFIIRGVILAAGYFGSQRRYS